MFGSEQYSFLPNPVDWTIDVYSIAVDGRLALSRNFSLTDEDIAELVAAGVPGAGDFPTFRFFTNDFATKTKGFDLTATTETEDFGGSTIWTVNWSQNNVDVTNAGSAIDALAEQSFKGVTPDNRGNFAANHRNGNWGPSYHFYG